MDPKRKIARILQWHRRRPSTQLRNEIIAHYMYLVKNAAERLHRRLPQSVEVDDLASDGFLGLLDAIESFDPEKALFSTYAALRIQGSMMDGLRSRDPISRTTRRKIRTLERAAEQVRARTGANPTPQELAREMGLSIAVCARTVAEARQTVTRSLSGGRIFSDEQTDQISIDTLRDPRQLDPARFLAQKILRETITTGLSRSERLITILYYFEGMTMKEIGATLELSESRVSQMHTSIVARLKAKLTEQQVAA